MMSSAVFSQSVVKNKKQVRQQDAYTTNARSAVTTMCNTLAPFKGNNSVADYMTNTRSSAVAERSRDASCHLIFRQVTQGHSRPFEMTLLAV